jgi:hypothetical protein
MPMTGEKTRRFAANSIFPSLFLAAFGWVLVQAWVVQTGGPWWLHAVFGIPGLTLSGLVLRRARLHWSAGIVDKGERRLSFNSPDFVWYLLLFGTGIVIALFASSALLLGFVTAMTYLVPWAKIPVCRARFIVSSIITLAGAIALLALYGKPAYPFHYLVAAWTVSSAPMLMFVLVLFSLPTGYRMREPAPVQNPGMDTHVPAPAADAMGR